MEDNRRIGSIDSTRAICMLWIIGVWHMQSYSNFSLGNDSLFCKLTPCVLGTFMFISGFFAGKN
mgnify:CR=1 FL=1